MFKLPFYGKEKMRLAFEYGIVLSEVAKEQGIKLTPEIVKRGEEILLKEFHSKNPMKIALEMIPNILATLEPDDKIKS